MAKNLILAQIWSSKFLLENFTFTRMLGIVASYNFMQYQGKLINQTWENSKKPSFGPDFGPFD